ncbi:TPR-like protein [Mycena latifolia]|nr:TPR-like protein [Mycena latifolia]
MEDDPAAVDSLELWVMHERLLLLLNSGVTRAQDLNMLGNICVQSYAASGTVGSLNQAVCAYKDAIRDDPDVEYLANLGSALDRRFKRLGDLRDLDQAVAKSDAAVGLTPDDYPAKAAFLNTLGNCLVSRFERVGDLADIDQAVAKLEASIRLTPDGHPDKPSRINNLGTSRLRRFERLGNLIDMDEGVANFQAAVGLTLDGDPDKPVLLHNLGSSLVMRFRGLGDITDIDQAVTKLEAAVRLTPDCHPGKPSRLSSLGNSLLSRFERLGNFTDIDQAVAKLKTAVRLTPDGHPDKPKSLSMLGNSLLSRFERLNDLTDIEQAVVNLEAVTKLTPDGHPNKPAYLNNLGNSLLRRFQRLGDLTDINKAVRKLEAAIRATPHGHQAKPQWLNSLGNSLLIRFEQLSDLNDIMQAVTNFEAAMGLTPYGHPDTQLRLKNLANSLLRRFEHLGDLTDINQAVAKFEASVAATPDGDPAKPSRLNNLGNSLLRRFQRLGDLTDINHGVTRFEDAIRLTPDDHPSKPSLLSSLGNSLVSRFERVGDLADINHAVAQLEAAIRLTPDGHPAKPQWLNNLGNSLLTRFEQFDNLTDINHAVAKFEASVEATPDGHPAKPRMLNNLGSSLVCRFEHLYDPLDYQYMLAQYTRSACSPTGPADLRFYASRMWAKYAQQGQDPSLLDAYSTAIIHLPELAWLGLSISDRHHHILEAGELVRDAASAAIAAKQYNTAVEWLEQGRSIIWGQVLSLRTPIDDLKRTQPNLAEELIFYSTQLTRDSIRSGAAEVPDQGLTVSFDSVPQRFHARQFHVFAQKRDEVINRIRKVPGFERFLMPKPISELSLAATRGPIVLLNISQYSSDALALMPGHGDTVLHVPLPEFTLQETQTLAESLGSLVRGAARSDRLDGCREGTLPPDDQFSNILSVLWTRIVKPVLDGIAFTTPSNRDLGRIWWCPTGPLAFLPIHAAGLYGENQPLGSKLSDFFISSYTPSLTALIEGFQASHQPEGRLQILAVAQPSATGQGYIPGTQQEITRIKQLATGKIPVLQLERDMATIDNVQEAMTKSRWAHFACHGVQDIFNPTNSALLLAGSSRLTLSQIIELSLPNAELAFLSACQTATGSRNLEDESVHLTAGMLLAGYRGVIGTMWSIMDHDAPQVAGDVYAHLFKTSPPDSTKAAEALHLAVLKLRDSDQAGGTKSFSQWVPFIHVGI